MATLVWITFCFLEQVGLDLRNGNYKADFRWALYVA